MKRFVLLQIMMIVFASDKNDVVETGTNSLESMEENNAEHFIIFTVKIEDDEYVKTNKSNTSKYIGTIYKESRSKWEAHRWSKNEKKLVYSAYYDDEETAAHASDTLARKLMAKGEEGHKLNFSDDNQDTEEDAPTSIYIGVSYEKKGKKWRVSRKSKKENKKVYNGSYKDQETAAHASDTLARTLMTNGKENHKLNFPDDYTEVYPKKFENKTSKYIGVCYVFNRSKWGAMRRSKYEKKMIYNGTYKDEKTAAHASDTLARKLTSSGEVKHELNFPKDYTEVHPEKRTNRIGVIHDRKRAAWSVRKWSRNEKESICTGYYKHEITAAHASGNLAKDDIEEVKYQKKRKRQDNSGNFQTNKY